ncbi:hypothetical protein HYW73_00005, partial [Candidatus Nomurabacteria bacterium]|nr:hypothetical protein [Candidatus Nomurabacteria bacterium]
MPKSLRIKGYPHLQGFCSRDAGGLDIGIYLTYNFIMKERYSLEQAQKEAEEIKNIVKYRGVKNYNEAEELHVIHLLNYGKVSDSALDHLSENFLRSPEAQIAAINGFYNLVNSGELGSALTIRNKFGISDEIIKSYEKFSVSMIKGIRRCDSHEAIIEFKNQIQLPKDILQKAAEERMLSYLEFPNFWCHNFESRTHEKAWIEKEICENFFYSQRFIEDFKNIISDIATSMVTDKFFLGPKPLVLELLKLFNLQNDFLESPEIQKNLTHTLFIFLKGRSYDDVMFFTHNFLTRDTLQSEKVKEKAIGLAQQCFQYGYGDEQRQFTHHASAKDLNVFKIGLEGYLDNLLQKSNFDEVLKFINQIPRNESLIKKILLFLFNSEDYENNIRGFKFLSERSDLQNISQVKEVARKSIINILKHDGSRAVMLYTNDEFDLYDDEFEKSPEVQTAIKEGVVLLVRRKDFGTILALSETFQAHFDAKLGTIFALNNQEGLVARSDFTLDDTPFIHEVMNALDFDSIPRQIVSSKEFKEFAYNYLLSEDKNNDELAIQALTARLDTPLSPQEYLNINLANPAFEGPEASPKLIIEELEKLLRTEGEDNTIADFLKLGVERFGSETMLQYMNRPDLSRHDALYFIPTILKLQEQSGLTPAQFGSNILLQVAKDGALYEGNSAHHFFATVSTALEKTSPQEIIQKIQKYSNVETLQELAKDVESGQSFFSWKNLKKLYEVNQLLGRTKIMDELNQGDISPRLRAFVEKLAFHPNISTEAVIQFWKQPAHFLDIDDVHTAENINRVKKPRNLLSLPFLDLTAEDLRDALVEGDLDDLQDLPPMEQNYYFGIPSREEVAGDPSIL